MINYWMIRLTVGRKIYLYFKIFDKLMCDGSGVYRLYFITNKI
jgi:hypothetical protein